MEKESTEHKPGTQVTQRIDFIHQHLDQSESLIAQLTEHLDHQLHNVDGKLNNKDATTDEGEFVITAEKLDNAVCRVSNLNERIKDILQRLEV